MTRRGFRRQPPYRSRSELRRVAAATGRDPATGDCCARRGNANFSARRVSSLHPVALVTQDDSLHYTSLKSPDEQLTFRFPGLSGKVVSSSDPQFAHKALIASIGGSWFPNCQDEAPFLEQLYRRYHSRGLEIVELSFEESSQLENPVRLKAVIRRYGITYPVLLAGTPDQLDQRFPNVAISTAGQPPSLWEEMAG